MGNSESNNLTMKEIFANNLKFQLEKVGKTPYAAAKEMKISHSHMYDLCNSEKPDFPKPQMMSKFASYFNCGEYELISVRHNDLEKAKE